MATFNITLEVVTVNAAFLERPVRLPLVSVANTGSHENYFHCVSKNAALHRLLVDERFVAVFGTLAKALRKSDILKTLKQMKDDEWARQVRASCGCSKTQRYTRRGQAFTNLVVLPDCRDCRTAGIDRRKQDIDGRFERSNQRCGNAADI